MPKKEKIDIYTFMKENLRRAGVKLAFGYGLRGKYIKLRFFDKKKFHLGLVLADKQDVGLVIGKNIKKNILTLDVGICAQLEDLMELNGIKPKLFAGISFNF